jgi:hypothetical protein
MNEKLLALAFLATLSTHALAHGDRPSRYFAYEIPALEMDDPLCVPGYATTQFLTDVNNRRFGAGGAGCYHELGVGSDGRPQFERIQKPYAWSPRTGAYLLPLGDFSSALPLGVDVRNNAYGFQSSAGLGAVQWTPGGGISEFLGVDPLCGFGLSLAIDANARGEIVGWAFRAPADPFSCTIRSVVVRPSGEEVVGPVDGSPANITNSGIVNGAIGGQAATWNWRTGAIVRLHQATGSETSTAYDLNERGIAVGVATVIESAGPPICARATPLMWDARGRERVLPKPPGAVTSTALDINEDGVIVGNSSTAACNDLAAEVQRATIWIDGRASDLNRLLVGRPGIVLLDAGTVTERGEILAAGYRAYEPEKPCPQTIRLPDGGFISDGSTCHDTHAYLLIPAD